MSHQYNISFLLIIVGFFLPLSVVGQLNTYTFEKIDSLQKIDKRKVIVFIHTDWCKYCQTMKNTTLKDNEIAKLLNENFWFATLNAEDKKDIVFNHHTFKYKPTGNNTGVNELAEQLGTIDDKITYPVMCILNEDYEIVFQYNQFLTSAELIKLLNEIIKNK